MGSIADIAQSIMQNPQFKAGLDMLTPPPMRLEESEVQKNQQAQAIDQARQQALQTDTANKAAMQQQLATSDGNDLLTLAQKIAPYDPELAARYYSLGIEKRKADAAANPFGVSTQPTGSSPGTPAVDDSGNAIDPNTATGEDFLKASNLPIGVQNQVRAIAQGRMEPFKGRALTTPVGQAIMNAVMQYDPDGFDTINTGKRAATAKDFASGASRKNINAIETAINHLGSLNNSADGLHNSDYPLWNSVANTVESARGDKALKDYTSALHIAAPEIARAVKQGQPTVEEICALEKDLDPSGSPDQFKSVIQGLVDKLNGRLEPVAQAYNEGMGTTKEGLSLLSPKTQKSYLRIMGKEAEVKSPDDVGRVSDDNSDAKAQDAGFSAEKIAAYKKLKGLK